MNGWRQPWWLGIIGAVTIAHQVPAAQHQEHARGHVDASNGDGRVISTEVDPIFRTKIGPC